MVTRTAVAMICMAAVCTIAAWPGSAHANPLSYCVSGPVRQPTAQTVEFDIDLVAEYLGGDVTVYREAGADSQVDPKSPTAVVVATYAAKDAQASSADNGSGVVPTARFTVREACVPTGTWSYMAFSDGNGMCGGSVIVTGVDPVCALVPGSGLSGADDDNEGGCAVTSTRSQAAGAAGLLFGLAVLGWLCRRR